jgi:tetratricopeptide (TPR) repeat protein
VAAYNVRGLILTDKTPAQPDDAIEAFQTAIKLLAEFEKTPEATGLRDRLLVFRGRIENNIGLSYASLHQTTDAEAHFRNSLRCKDAAGNILGRAQTCLNLCRMFYAQHIMTKYRYWRGKGMSLIRKYDLRYQHAELLRETGRIDCETGKTVAGRKKLAAALHIYEQMPDASFDLRQTRALIDRCT